MRHLLLAIISSLFLLTACNDAILGEDLESNDAFDNFEYLWEECRDRYSFFELKNIDWDSVRRVYTPRIRGNTRNQELFTILAEMLNELKDGHVNLISDFNVSFYPFDRLSQDNFDFRIIEDNYLPDNYNISSGVAHSLIAGGEMGYIRYSSFLTTVLSDNFGYILGQYEDTRGVIIDMRENGGGVVLNVYSLLGYFTDEPTLVARSRIKSGPGINEFSPLEDIIVQPKSDMFDKPVIVLVDRGSYSATSFFSLATKAFPNITLIGDTTGGGLGAPNGGQLPNGWTYRFSITQTLDLDGNNFENGVPPDIEAFVDWENRNRDEVLERAIQELF